MLSTPSLSQFGQSTMPVPRQTGHSSATVVVPMIFELVLSSVAMTVGTFFRITPRVHPRFGHSRLSCPLHAMHVLSSYEVQAPCCCKRCNSSIRCDQANRGARL